MRFFNTAGPIKSARHYAIPPLERLDLKANTPRGSANSNPQRGDAVRSATTTNPAAVHRR